MRAAAAMTGMERNDLIQLGWRVFDSATGRYGRVVGRCFCDGAVCDFEVRYDLIEIGMGMPCRAPIAVDHLFLLERGDYGFDARVPHRADAALRECITEDGATAVARRDVDALVKRLRYITGVATDALRELGGVK